MRGRGALLVVGGLLVGALGIVTIPRRAPRLNELATTIRDGRVWVDPRQVITGACPSCVR